MASISDILSSVTHAHAQANPHLSSTSRDEQQRRDARALTRAWVAERTAPELLPWPGELVERMMQSVASQIATIEELTSGMDAGASFTLVVLQTELERVKFMLRSFLRARIAKISAHPDHYTNLTAALNSDSDSNPNSSTPNSTPNPLSAPEQTFLAHHTAHRSTHYARAFLAAFPPKLRRPTADTSASSSSAAAADAPDTDRAVFVRGLRGGSGVRVGCGYTGNAGADADGDGDGDAGAGTAARERVVAVRRGEVWVVRWSAVREAVRLGEVELV